MKRRAFLRPALAVLLLSSCERDAVLVELEPSFAVSRSEVTTAAALGTGPVSEVVTIVNGTDGTLRGLSAEVQYPSGPGDWLTARFDQTTATREQPATLRLEANPDDLELGSFDAVVLLRADAASNGPFRLQVHLTVRPRPPARVELLTQLPDQATNGAPLGAASVRLLNSLGEPTPVAGVVITASLTGGGTLSGGQAVATDADGQATFADLAITGLVGPKTLVFGGADLAPASQSLVLVAGPAARLTAGSALTQTAPAGSPAPAPPAVRTEDQSGNPVGGVTVTFTPSAGGAVAPTGPVASGVDGVARLAAWRLRDAAGENTVVAAAAGLAGSPITFRAAGEAGPPVALTKVSGDDLLGIVATTLGTPHVVRIVDAAGNGVAGVTVTWNATGGGSVAPASTVTDTAGLAAAIRTLGPAPGPVATTATAQLSGAPVSVTFAVTAAVSGPAQLVAIAGDGQIAPVGTTLPAPLAVRVVDTLGNGLAGVAVKWTTQDLGGSFPSGATSLTDPSGLAVATWRLGTSLGTQTAQAAVGGPPPATFTARAQVGPVSPTLSTVVAFPSQLTAGSGRVDVVVTARDAGGNLVSGATVTLAATGAGTLVPPSAPTSGSGMAVGTYSSTVTGLKVISAIAGGVALSQTATVSVTPGPPATLSPATATAFSVHFNQPVSPSPAVLAADGFGNPVPGTGVTFTVSRGASLLNGSSAPVNVATNANGVATIGSWFVQGITGAVLGTIDAYNELRATVAGATPATFTGTIDLRYLSSGAPGSDGVSSLIATNCLSSGCHPASGDLSYGMLVAGASPSTRFVAAGDTLTITGSYNRLLAKIGGTVGHGGGRFPTSIVTLFAAWVKQGARQN